MQWDLGSNQATQVAQHDAPISEMAFIPSLNCLATGSWDKTLRFWDLRQSNPIHKVDLGERCLAMAHRDASAQVSCMKFTHLDAAAACTSSCGPMPGPKVSGRSHQALP